MYYHELERIIQKVLEGVIGKEQLMEFLMDTFDCEKICDSNDLLVSDAYFCLMHYASGEENIVAEEWKYFLECFQGIRKYNMNEKNRIIAPYITKVEL